MWAKPGRRLRTTNKSALRANMSLTGHVHVPIARRRHLRLLVLSPLDHVVNAKAVDALLLLAVGLARLVGVVASRLAALELGARLGGLVLDLLVGLRLGDGVIEEL